MSKKFKPPVYTGPTVKALRKKLGLNQSQFWGPLGVTQSCASRYKSGRNIPRPVRKLIWVMYESPLAMAEKHGLNPLVNAAVFLEKLGSI